MQVWQPTHNAKYYAAKALIAAAGETPPKHLSPAHVASASIAIMAHQNQSTRHQQTVALRAVLGILWEEHGAPNLKRLVPQVVKPAPRNVTITADERDAIITAAPPGLRVWLLLCSDLALRAATAARISPKDYNDETREISFRTKFGTAQTLPVTDALAELFAQVTHGETRPYAIALRTPNPSARPGPNYVQSLRRQFHITRKKLGITRNITPHDLRRTTAVRTLEVTADLRVVQALLGHRNLATTLYYLDHRNTPVDRAVLEVAKLNERKKH